MINIHRRYECVVALVDDLVDEVGDDEIHPLASFIERYGDEHVPSLENSPQESGE